MAEPVSYQLQIELTRTVRRRVGRLGVCEFPPGRYVYTGSARRNFEARLARHAKKEKALRWHIDYLLTARGVRITNIVRSAQPECRLNQAVPGAVLIAGFGSSDCRAGCRSHLRYLGDA